MAQKHRFWNERGKFELFLAEHSDRPKIMKIADHFTGDEYTREEAEEVFVELFTLCLKYNDYDRMAKKTIRRRKWLFALAVSLIFFVLAIVTGTYADWAGPNFYGVATVLLGEVGVSVFLIVGNGKNKFIESTQEQLRLKNFAKLYELCRWLKELTEKYEINPKDFTVDQEMFSHFMSVGSGH